jgi:UDP-GlcNAc:undecaprenyl-phosphate GlcNAc-1-phosphate transferase
MNMLNWSKGVDGQMPGVAAISAIIIGIASLRFPVLTEMNIVVSQASFIVAGAALGFNFYPAKIFPGYSATILGFMIGVLSIISGVKLATAVLVMGVPAADFLFTFIRRVASHKSPFQGDREHLHHLLLSSGLGQRKIALFYWIMSTFLGLFALTLSSRGKLFAIILVVVLVGAIIFTLKFLGKRNFEEHV